MADFEIKKIDKIYTEEGLVTKAVFANVEDAVENTIELKGDGDLKICVEV